MIKFITMQFEYSIEYCHIYSNETIGPEHAESLDYLVDIKKQLDLEKCSYYLCVMLDNYTFPDRIFDKDIFFEWLRARGQVPDVFISEGDLISAADEVINLVGDKRANYLRNYVKDKKYPCSLLIATWYLSRMGKLKNSPASINKYSNKLMNILHIRLKEHEDEAREIIKDTKFALLVDNITNKYFGGINYPNL